MSDGKEEHILLLNEDEVMCLLGRLGDITIGSMTAAEVVPLRRTYLKTKQIANLIEETSNGESKA